MTEVNTSLLKLKIEQQNISLRQLSKETAIHTSTISRILSGKRKATLEHLQAFSRCLDIPLSELIRENNSDEEEIPGSFYHIHSIVNEMQLPIENFTFDALKQKLAIFQEESMKESGRTTILQQFKTKLGELNSQGPFIKQLKEMEQIFKEQKATRKDLILIGSALLYFVASVDMIPDYLFPVGYLDDAFVAQYVMQQVSIKQ
ncbi:helix-turn-helix domain-containing protein [Ornithinibacillus massiliensis]|uniref:Helix-turn-helix domain-containing protein n=1 Tax=Ornithinibacillus massiliensis TaxID=1944633 RepID=A0ABS5MHN4_9BACI|nr:helix-turn-helix domain-containing protein [Ornithinibacillus massiliensis]MBS3681829.1 helix-turn-helix domain-containing protein [Ornithinibacillus massiliensis]